ncbi:MAG: hypothetical protein KAK00_01315 [Nanoarchaeota archaeon]|nr:hypothetical protein [Nanoarchaeota archaeon]
MKQPNLKKHIRFLAIILLILLSFLLLNIVTVKADFYELIYKCENNQCVEGDIAEWNIKINNEGDSKIEVKTIEIRDSINNSIIAIFDTDYYPLMDYRGDLFVIQAKQERTKTIRAEIPKANNGTSLIYHLCFTNAVNEPYLSRDEIYTVEHCYSDRNEIMPILKCASNSSCNNDEYCLDNECVKLECGYCQYISFHRCANFECCDSNKCEEDEACKKRRCIKLDCMENEYLSEHICIPLNCSSNEFIFNHSCVGINCGEDEFILNRSCVRLNCSEDEFILNRSCVRLNCSEDEFILNRSCVRLNCMFNETAISHKCQALKCYFFQKIANNRCINNKPLIFKLSIEFIIVSTIIAILIIDIKRYKSTITKKEKSLKIEEK